MKKIYFLSTCNTCKRIITELNLGDEYVKQDIKTEAITLAQLEEMRSMTDSYATLFSKRSRKYRAMDLHDNPPSEDEMK